MVSRHRPAALARCLTALRQLDHPDFEVVVVACPAGADVAARFPCKVIPFDVANISQARNLGLAAAAAPLVAFIDDDAVPEPTWLSRLLAPFQHPAVMSSGGYVRGRDGLRFQWRARWCNRCGESFDLALPPLPRGDTAHLLPAPPDGAIRTEGTNCAFRADALAAIGGFDPGYAFYLDETDVNLRLAAVPGALTAIVPAAQVHHGFAESRQRRADKVPRTLHDIGASSAHFWAKHTPDADRAGARKRLWQAQFNRLIRHMVTGALEPREVAPLMRTLAAGLNAAPPPAPPPGTAATATATSGNPAPFMPYPAVAGRGLVLTGRPAQEKALRARAASAAAQGQIVTLIILSRSRRRLQQRFLPEGFWMLSGGIWGRSAQTRRSRAFTFAQRIAVEVLNLRQNRPIS
ncbi:glycosyltransferase family 2 protein [Phaeovulum sp. W22_SRMD_FR3]|uniref:glycosyltransferase family 2 protein n=1 Tax=Phaeovulum sp. W22_SRMD_FR3 TaxID=3240274 RepID=UPI003F9E35A6